MSTEWDKLTQEVDNLYNASEYDWAISVSEKDPKGQRNLVSRLDPLRVRKLARKSPNHSSLE